MVPLPSPVKLVGLSQGAANGVQAIVNLHFRTEHRALLDLFEDLRKRVDKSSADAERRVEESQIRLEETENRLKKIEDECRDLVQRNKEWEDQVRDLKSKMEWLGGILGTGTRPTSATRSHDILNYSDSRQSGPLCTTAAPQGPQVDRRQQRSQLSSIVALPTHGHIDTTALQDPTVASSITSPRADMSALEKSPTRATTRDREPDLRPVTGLSQASNTTLEDRDHPSNIYKVSQEISSPPWNDQTSLRPLQSPLIATRETEQFLTLSSKPSQKAASNRAVNNRSWVDISQAADQDIQSYLDNAAEYIGPMKQRTDQFRFIARFIGGLFHEKDRNILLEQLKKKFFSRTNKDGFVEVRCGFADVGDALMATGLLRTHNGKRNAGDAGMNDEMNSVYKRRKTLDTQLSERYDDEL